MADRDVIISAAIAGASMRAIARRLGVSVDEVTEALKVFAAEVLSPCSRARILAVEVERLDQLEMVFFQHAIQARDAAAGTLVAKISQRRAALLGLDQPVRLDMHVVAEHVETSTDYYERVLAQLKGQTALPPDADGEPGKPN